ncbi:hypothetical protein HYE68_002874 [Fusarium pseudograminearum]|nr:hypothetical protein HYE68_002874 [Fusarium pseudograminearum]
MVIHDRFNLDIVENDTSRDGTLWFGPEELPPTGDLTFSEDVDMEFESQLLGNLSISDDVDMDRELEQELPKNDDDMEAESESEEELTESEKKYEAERKRAIREGKKPDRPNQTSGGFPLYNPNEREIIRQGFSEAPGSPKTIEEIQEHYIPGLNCTIARPPLHLETQSSIDSITVRQSPPTKRPVGRPRKAVGTAKKPANRRAGNRPVKSNAHQTYNLPPSHPAYQRLDQQRSDRKEDAPDEVRVDSTPNYLSRKANLLTLNHGREDIFDGVDPIMAREVREFWAREGIETPFNNKALYILHHLMMKREEKRDRFFKESEITEIRKRIRFLNNTPLNDAEKAEFNKLFGLDVEWE